MALLCILIIYGGYIVNHWKSFKKRFTSEYKVRNSVINMITLLMVNDRKSWEIDYDTIIHRNMKIKILVFGGPDTLECVQDKKAITLDKKQRKKIWKAYNTMLSEKEADAAEDFFEKVIDNYKS